MKKVNQLIEARWGLPMSHRHPEIMDHWAVAISDGVIVETGPSDTLNQTYTADEHIQLKHHVLLPGFINAHTHSPMVLLRALSDDVRLENWLKDCIWPAEKSLISESFIEDGMRLAIAEMLRSGTTCINEHYFMPSIAAQACQTIGMRAVIGLWVGDIQLPWAPSVDACFEAGLKLLDQAQFSDIIQFSWAPHSPYLLNDAQLKQLASCSNSTQLPVHIHCHETQHEIEHSMRTLGLRPLARLASSGLLNERLILVHMVETNQEDLAQLAAAGSHVITCPKSNAKLASGHTPLVEIRNAGINVGLGTDSAASNNSLDMLEECRMMALFSKAVTQNPAALSAYDCLYAATMGNAQALGLETQIGSIDVGKQADLIAVNLDALNTYPHHHPIAQLVYAAHSQQISHVWTQGRLRIKEGSFIDIDEQKLKRIAKNWSDKTSKFSHA